MRGGLAGPPGPGGNGMAIGIEEPENAVIDQREIETLQHGVYHMSKPGREIIPNQAPDVAIAAPERPLIGPCHTMTIFEHAPELAFDH
jgi:hypothetical protein